MAKLSKRAVRYRPAWSWRRRCGTCAMFRAAGSGAGGCSLVAGRIRRWDVCDRWIPAKGDPWA